MPYCTNGSCDGLFWPFKTIPHHTGYVVISKVSPALRSLESGSCLRFFTLEKNQDAGPACTNNYKQNRANLNGTPNPSRIEKLLLNDESHTCRKKALPEGSIVRALDRHTDSHTDRHWVVVSFLSRIGKPSISFKTILQHDDIVDVVDGYLTCSNFITSNQEYQE